MSNKLGKRLRSQGGIVPQGIVETRQLLMRFLAVFLICHAPWSLVCIETFASTTSEVSYGIAVPFLCWQGFLNWLSYAANRSWFLWCIPADRTGFIQDLEAARQSNKDESLFTRYITGLQCYIKSNDIIYGDLIGHGSTSKVYNGKFAGTSVAIKVCTFPQHADQARAGQNNFEKEVSVLISAAHPNVVRFFGLLRFAGNFQSIGIVTELCVESVACKIQRLHSEGKSFLSPDVRASMVKLMIDISHGLACLHSKGIIHGDLKPANVLLDQFQTAKLCDFGLSRIAGVTVGSSCIGTITYMAPELLVVEENAHDISTKVDIWALGTTFWSMIELKEPFGDENPSIFWVAKHVNEGNSLTFSSDWRCPVLEGLVSSFRQLSSVDRPTAYDATQSLKRVRKRICDPRICGLDIPERFQVRASDVLSEDLEPLLELLEQDREKKTILQQFQNTRSGEDANDIRAGLVHQLLHHQQGTISPAAKVVGKS